MSNSENPNGPRIAFITGGSRGIGYETARQLGAQGFQIIIASRDLAQGQKAAAELSAEGAQVSAIALDITSDASVQAVAASLEAKHGRVDVLINNAGGNFDGGNLASTVPMAFVQETLEMNLLGAWRVTQALLPLLRQSAHARIVNVSSGAGAFESEIAFGLAKMGGAAPAYAVSKAALSALTLKLASELQGTGLLINAVCPGWTATYPGAAEQGARPVSEGAAGVVWAAQLPDDGPTGGFFRDGQRVPW